MVEQIQAVLADGLAGRLGIEVTAVDSEKVEGRLKVEPAVCTTGEILHGGAIMSLADTLGGIGAFLNLPPGARTSTVESKTNFLKAAKLGDTVTGVSRLVNKGRTLMLWQTEIRSGEGKLVAVVSQSQIILQ